MAINQIEHRRTDIGSPHTNGFRERFHRMVKEEFYSVAFRRTLYESVAHLQQDLDTYLDFYNHDRAHQGHRTKGRTPFVSFQASVAVRRQPELGGEAA